MKIKQIKKNNSWIVRLEYQGTIYQGEGKTRAEALKQAFSLV